MRFFSRLVFVPNHPRAHIDFSSNAYRYALLSAASLTAGGSMAQTEFAELWRVEHDARRHRGTSGVRSCLFHQLAGLGPRSRRMGPWSQAEPLPERAGGI